MDAHVVTTWFCAPCEVEGRDPDADPTCWNCGGAVTVTARSRAAWVGSDFERAMFSPWRGFLPPHAA